MAARRTRRGFATTSRFGSWSSSTSGSARRSTKSTRSGGSSYMNLKNCFQQKINSYRTLVSQTQGASGAGRPSPATLNSFANWINKGCVIHKVSSAQISRWSPSGKKCSTPSTAKTILYSKFGKSPIKAVCKSKGGSFLVATTPTYRGRSFKFPR